MQKNKYDLVEDFANYMKCSCDSCPLRNECNEHSVEIRENEPLCKNTEKTKELLIKKYNL